MTNKIPFIHCYIYSKIIKKCRGNIVPQKYLFEILRRIIICSNTEGGDRRGIPNKYRCEVIKDLLDLRLLKKRSIYEYEILENSHYKEIKSNFF